MTCAWVGEAKGSEKKEVFEDRGRQAGGSRCGDLGDVGKDKWRCMSAEPFRSPPCRGNAVGVFGGGQRSIGASPRG